MSSSDASLRRLSVLVSRYLHLGQHLQKCRELLPHASSELVDIERALALTHQEMTGFEDALGLLIDESMVLHDDLRRGKFQQRRRAVAIASSIDRSRS